MESDFPIPVEVSGKRRRKKVEIAIFDYDHCQFARIKIGFGESRNESSIDA
jgi:hypothetical protein